MKKTIFTFYDFLWPKSTLSSIGLFKKFRITKFLHCDSTKKIISLFLHFDPKKRHWIEKSHKLLFTPTQQSRSRENYFSSLLFSLTHVRVGTEPKFSKLNRARALTSRARAELHAQVFQAEPSPSRAFEPQNGTPCTCPTSTLSNFKYMSNPKPCWTCNPYPTTAPCSTSSTCPTPTPCRSCIPCPTPSPMATFKYMSDLSFMYNPNHISNPYTMLDLHPMLGWDPICTWGYT